MGPKEGVIGPTQKEIKAINQRVDELDKTEKSSLRRKISRRIAGGVLVASLLTGGAACAPEIQPTPATATEAPESTEELTPTSPPTETSEPTETPLPTETPMPVPELVRPESLEIFGAGGPSEEFEERVKSGEFSDQEERLEDWVKGSWAELGIFHPDTERVHYKYFQDLGTKEILVAIESQDYPNQIIYYPLDLKASQELGEQVFDTELTSLDPRDEMTKSPLFLSLSGSPEGTNLPEDTVLAVKNGNWVMVNPEEKTVGEINLETGIWKKVEFPTYEIASEVLVDIKNEFGVEIPSKADSKYTAGERLIRVKRQGGIELLNNGENAVLNLEEALTTKEVLSKISYAGSLVDLILVYRFRSDPEIRPLVAHGAYWGYRYEDWLKYGPRPYYLPVYENQTLEQIAIQYGFESVEELYEINKNIFDSLEPNSILEPGTKLKMYHGSLQGRKKAIMIYLPENLDLNSSLPDLSQHSPLMVVNEEDLQFLNQPEEISYSTQKDYFRKVLIHEFGHAIADAISMQAASSEKEYATERGTMHLCGLISMEDQHPLYQAFAELNGWKLESHREISRLCGLSSEDIPVDSYGWVRDSQGRESSSRVRISHRATLDKNIEEVFADFFMASIEFPELLTRDERVFFERIHEGLDKNPQQFLEKVSADSSFLVEGLNQ